MDRELRRMCGETHDMIVVGGGVVGAMIAWDASLRGMKVALVEKDDFAAGASSHNSKFIHGGLNHLEARDLGLVREFIAERRVWSLIAPHLTRPMPFLLPSYEGLKPSAARIGLGLHIHDLLAFDRDFVLDPDLQLPGPRRISINAALERAPFLPTDGLTSTYLYHECQMRFPERLVIELLRGAIGHGARVANYAEATDLITANETVTGIRVYDRLTNWRGVLSAPLVVSAAGPWTPNLLKTAQKDDNRQMKWVRGVHILTDALMCECAVRLPIDGSNLVLSRWRGMTLIGTLNTELSSLESGADSGHVSQLEVQTLVDRVNKALGSNRLKISDVRHAFSGIRPIPSHDNARLYERGRRIFSKTKKSRWEITDHSILNGAAKLDGFISVLSGNWTRARRIAEDAVNLAALKLDPKSKRRWRRCRTNSTALWGGEVWRMRLFRSAAALRHPDIAPGILRNLVNAYGSRFREVLALATADDRYWARIDPERPEIGAQVIYAVRREWARNLDDVLYRRIGIGQTGKPSEAALNAVADLMTDELQWTQTERSRQIESAKKRYQSS